VSAEPGAGGTGAGGAGLAAAIVPPDATGSRIARPSCASAPPNSTMTAFCWLRMDGVAGFARSIRTRAMPMPSSPVPASTATLATAPDGVPGRTPPGATLRRSTSSVSGSGCAAT